MQVQIVAQSEARLVEWHRAVDAVAREKRFLAFTEAPPLDASTTFFRHLLDGGGVQMHALLDDVLVGWCDVLFTRHQARAHVGTLGIGLLPSARHRGIGRRLMQATIDAAWDHGLTRIELTVREDNLNARALYERLGFRHEGIRRHDFRVDGRYFDTHAMALLCDGLDQDPGARDSR